MLLAPVQKKNIANKDVWVTFAEAKDIKRGEIISGFQYGQEIALACTKNGAIYALSNKLPPTSQPSTLGNIFGDDIVEPLCGTAFSLKTGKVNGDWCPSFLGKLIFGRLVPPTNVPVFKTRTQGGKVQVRGALRDGTGRAHARTPRARAPRESAAHTRSSRRSPPPCAAAGSDQHQRQGAVRGQLLAWRARLAGQGGRRLLLSIGRRTDTHRALQGLLCW